MELTNDNSCILPVTQGELGDTLGLTIVHTNRMLQVLRSVGQPVMVCMQIHGQQHCDDKPQHCQEADHERQPITTANLPDTPNPIAMIENLSRISCLTPQFLWSYW